VKLTVSVLVALAAVIGGALEGMSSQDQPSEPTAPAQSGGARSDSAPSGSTQSGAVLGTVDHVTDGDTLTVRNAAGRQERVRLIGIDAPELSTTRTGYAECGGSQARAELLRLAPRGSRVRFAADPSQDPRDRFGRLLGYLSPDRGGAATFQEQLLRAGWARVYVYDRSPFSRVDEFRAAAAQARAASRGVWSQCGGRFDRPAS
jgi:endonuclease YncB( thermonuclease family)